VYAEGRVAYIVLTRQGPSSGFVFAEAILTHDVIARAFALRAQLTFIMFCEEVARAAPYFAPELQDALRGRGVLHCGTTWLRTAQP